LRIHHVTPGARRRAFDASKLQGSRWQRHGRCGTLRDWQAGSASSRLIGVVGGHAPPFERNLIGNRLRRTAGCLRAAGAPGRPRFEWVRGSSVVRPFADASHDDGSLGVRGAEAVVGQRFSDVDDEEATGKRL
jgi:hypothetical protein